MPFATPETLQAGLEDVRAAPREIGTVELIVRRPDVDLREIVEAADLDVELGLVGDDWWRRAGVSDPGRSVARHAQITVMSSRFARLIAGERDRWAQAGDQLYVDMDLSITNLPPGTQLQVGSALIRVSEVPHTGCAKFSARFGSEALRVANSPEGRELRLRGLNATVLASGSLRVGDRVSIR